MAVLVAVSDKEAEGLHRGVGTRTNLVGLCSLSDGECVSYLGERHAVIHERLAGNPLCLYVPIFRTTAKTTVRRMP